MSATNIHTISSREFGQNVSSAKHLAKAGPVFITDRGEPAFVLLSIADYRHLSSGEGEMSLLELMDSLPDTSEVEDFEISPLAIQLSTKGCALEGSLGDGEGHADHAGCR